MNIERMTIPAQSIECGDIILTTNAEDHRIVYADQAISNAYWDTGWDGVGGFVYVTTEHDSYRFGYDEIVTVLRGLA